MDIKALKESTEKIVAMLDIYQNISRMPNRDRASLSANKYKLDYIKKHLLDKVRENKKICENIISRIKNESN